MSQTESRHCAQCNLLKWIFLIAVHKHVAELVHCCRYMQALYTAAVLDQVLPNVVKGNNEKKSFGDGSWLNELYSYRTNQFLRCKSSRHMHVTHASMELEQVHQTCRAAC